MLILAAFNPIEAVQRNEANVKLGSVFFRLRGKRRHPRPDSRRYGGFAVAAVNRATADKLPAIAMMRRLADHADDARGVDGYAANLTERGSFVRFRGSGRNNRDPLGHPATDALMEAVENHQGLADSLQKPIGIQGEIAVYLNKKPLGINRDQHAWRWAEVMQVFD